ncbi:MAG: diphosphomevalonate decarboxylase [Myxococcota bacterium]|jgi:diphosphomevalonate decarboxylase
MSNGARQATATAHANIALVKYWGKRDVPLNLPAAGSLSLTLSGLTTTTTVRFGAARDSMTINESPLGLGKAAKVLDIIRGLADLDAPAECRSTNDFPTGAGLASSASGLAALTVAAAAAAGLELSAERLSAIARIGSGSATRSLFGGFAEWRAGVKPDGSDSHAVPLFGPQHWDLRVVVAVVSARPKAVGSTEGMTRTLKTSPFHRPWLETVDADLVEARAAVEQRDLAALGRVAERSCLRMHALMMGADPALMYLRSESWAVIEAVRALQKDGVPCFFTADAGPNVKVFCAPEAVAPVRDRLLRLRCVRGLVAARPGPGARVVARG